MVCLGDNRRAINVAASNTMGGCSVTGRRNLVVGNNCLNSNTPNTGRNRAILTPGICVPRSRENFCVGGSILALRSVAVGKFTTSSNCKDNFETSDDAIVIGSYSFARGNGGGHDGPQNNTVCADNNALSVVKYIFDGGYMISDTSDNDTRNNILRVGGATFAYTRDVFERGCMDKTCRNNVKNTISVDNKDTMVDGYDFRAGFFCVGAADADGAFDNNVLVTDRLAHFRLGSIDFMKNNFYNVGGSMGVENNTVALDKGSRGACVHGMTFSRVKSSRGKRTCRHTSVCVPNNALCVAGILINNATGGGTLRITNKAIFVRGYAVTSTRRNCNVCRDKNSLDIAGSVI